MTEEEWSNGYSVGVTIKLSNEPRKIPRTGLIEFIRVKLLRMRPRFIILPSVYETIKNAHERAQKAMADMIEKPLYKHLGAKNDRGN